MNISSDLVHDFIKILFSRRVSCPHCSSKHIVLYGKFKGKQRYKCKTCKKTFSDLTNTPFSMSHHLDKLPGFLNCMIRSQSLRESASELNISYVTLFYWRHKILKTLKKEKPKVMKGTVELDDVYVNYSSKGQKNAILFNKKRSHRKSRSYLNLNNDKICVLACLDNSSNSLCSAVCQGNLSTERVEKAIGKVINKDNIVYSKRRPAYISFFRKIHLKMWRTDITLESDARRYINSCLDWMTKFKGVATKYLNNYLRWYKIFFEMKSLNKTADVIKSILKRLRQQNGYETYISVSKWVGFES